MTLLPIDALPTRQLNHRSFPTIPPLPEQESMNRVETTATIDQLTQLLPTDTTDFDWSETLPVGRPRIFNPARPLASFMPVHYEPGYAYPLLVWLHDCELNEDCLPQLMPHVSLRNFVAVAPRGTVTQSRGYSWRQELAAIEAAEAAVDDAIERAGDRFNINSDRILLAGHGSGGTMALRLAMQDPGRFAGVASIAGRLPKSYHPLANINQFRKLPVMIASGLESLNYDQWAACDDLRLLHSAGCQVAIRQYPDDDLTDTMLGDLNRWLMEIVCGSKPK